MRRIFQKVPLFLFATHSKDQADSRLVQITVFGLQQSSYNLQKSPPTKNSLQLQVGLWSCPHADPFIYIYLGCGSEPIWYWAASHTGRGFPCGQPIYRKLANKSRGLSLYKPRPSCGYYSRAAFIRNGIQSNFMQTMRLLFEGGFYSRAAFIGEFTV